MLAESDPEPRPCKFTRMKNTLLIQQRHASVADVDLEMHCVMHLQTPSSQTQCWKSYCSRDKVPPSVYRISVQQARDPKATESHVDSINNGIAFAGLVSYIEEVRMDSLVTPVFKRTDLVNLYHERLEQLGTYTS